VQSSELEAWATLMLKPLKKSLAVRSTVWLSTNGLQVIFTRQKSVKPMKESVTPMKEPTENQNGDAASSRRKGLLPFVRSYLPMLLLSLTLHLFILFVISLIPEEKVSKVEEKTIITVFEEKKEEEIPEIIEKIELEVKPVTVDTTVTTTTTTTMAKVVEVDDAPMEMPSDSPNELMELAPDAGASNDIPNLAVIGLKGGASGGSGLPTGYSNRSGKAKGKALHRGGGDTKSESSVDAALQWLALHQEPDGSWDPVKYEGEFAVDKAAITGCALLAFLGAGHNEVAGKYRKTVKDGVKYLNSLMADPRVYDTPRFTNNYGTALALMALAEDTIFGASPSTKKNANRIAEFLIAQYIKNPEGGWSYNSSGEDLSVSGWVALGLKSAKAADLPALHTDEAKIVFDHYKIWVDKKMTNPETGYGIYHPDPKWAGKVSQHMGWVGMFQKQFLGFPVNDPFLKKAAEVSIQSIASKKWIGGDQPGDVYGVYYGTLAAFQQQGPMWMAWNPAMKLTLVKSQQLGDPKEKGGSWDPTSGACKRGGRVMSTALFALCLEVYYRYDMMH
jgi:hypothetical protein